MRSRSSSVFPSSSSEHAVAKVLGPPPHKHIPAFRPPPPSIPHANPDAPVSVVWFRGHDLRVHDHAALDAAVQSGATIVALYVLECGPEAEDPNNYVRRRRTPRSPVFHSHATSSSHSDIMSTVTSDSAPTQPTASRQPKRSRMLLECERYPWGPLSPNGGFAMGRVQRWYLHHSLCVLQQQLEHLGITLILRRVDSADETVPVVVSVAKALGAGAVLWNKRYKPCAYPVDEAVNSSLQTLGIYAHEFDSETLMPPSISLCGRYDDFQSYTRFWIDAMRACPPPRPNKPLEKSHVKACERSRVHCMLSKDDTTTSGLTTALNYMKVALPSVMDLELLDGLSLEGPDSPGNVDTIGCVAAREAVARFLQKDRFSQFANGSARRDGMVTGKDLATSHVSPHVRFGEISPRVLFYEIVDAGVAAQDIGNDEGREAARTFLKNMSLRDFGYYMLSRYPSAAYKPIMPEFEVFPWEYDDTGALTHAWETGTTGFPIVDAAMRQLLREGWLHNRMRFLVASFFCKYLLLPWPVGAAHLVRTLVDGDEACNSLGWQWTAGCNSDSFPFSTLVNPLSLYTHTRSRKRAAEYVRKYVPELAHLPDSLVFTPWRATEAERKTYHLNILPLPKYNEVRRDALYCTSVGSETTFYPQRVVRGKDARSRARRAMEVMRRIFSAQRQCRTIIVEQRPPGFRSAYRKHSSNSETEGVAKKQRIVEGVQILGANGELSVELDISDIDSSVSRAAPEKISKKVTPRRRREYENSETLTSIVKRRRTSGPSIAVLEDQPCSPAQSPNVNSRPMMSIAQLSSPLLEPGSHITESPKPQMRNGIDSLQPPSGRKNTGVKSMGTDRGVTDRSHDSPTNLKRPRPMTPNISQTSSSRLSVKSLLSSSLTHDAEVTTQAIPSSLLRSPNGLLVGSTGNPTVLPKLTQTGPHQNLTSAAGSMSPSSKTPDLLTNGPNQFIRSPTSLSGDVAPPFTPNPLTPLLRAPVRKHETPMTHPIPIEDIRTPPIGGRTSHLQTSSSQYQGGTTYDNGTSQGNPARDPRGEGSSMRPTVQVQAPGPRPQMKRDIPDQMPPFDMQRTHTPAMFHPSVSPVPLISNHYQHSLHHNPHMMMSFRPPANNPMQLPHMSPQGGAMPSPGVSQGYFATSPISANPHQPTNQQVVWYPALSPYVELRGPGLAGNVFPHLLHPMQRQHPHGMPMGYQMHRANAMAGQVDPTRMVPQAGASVPFTEADGNTRRGPNSPVEREAIARRMAAMDYHDDNYGGKHWEQWQAISLHLLNQYEFSQDTDRETSRAYVRLCVLKDELRDANPNGPRVTVNHCKEVFRILNLPVTGEWDRRGHGGVRGPYVYGCVKKSGVQVSRR